MTLDQHLAHVLGVQRCSLTARSSGIQSTYQVQAEGVQYFAKVYASPLGRQMMEAERTGLQRLAQTRIIQTPEIVASGHWGHQHFLILTHIKDVPPSSTFWQTFGRSLAGLHQASQAAFGLDHDNFIGVLPQRNNRCEDWSDFYRTQRILPQADAAHQAGLISSATRHQFDRKRTGTSIYEESTGGGTSG